MCFWLGQFEKWLLECVLVELNRPTIASILFKLEYCFLLLSCVMVDHLHIWLLGFACTSISFFLFFWGGGIINVFDAEDFVVLNAYFLVGCGSCWFQGQKA